MSWSVCVFARNEERLLPHCLAALGPAAAGGAFVAHVMVNGSTDGTARVAGALAAADPRLRVHEIALGDKANAWNDYVHRISGTAAMHVFIDGDVRPSAGAFAGLAKAFASETRAYGVAALPAAGRTRRGWAKKLFEGGWLSGNLYAVTGTALSLIKERGIRMPVGAYGEDGLLSYLFLTDLRGGADDSHKQRIAIADDAFFEFDSLGANARDVEIYRRRLRRYSQRYVQNQILYPILKARGVAAMPADIREIFTLENLRGVRPRLNLESFLFDVATLRRLRAEATR
jgi:glycosyltransferase involved in cell wall biosynthesis